MPPSAILLSSILPPPHCFHGPFVVLDQLMDTIIHSTIPEVGK